MPLLALSDASGRPDDEHDPDRPGDEPLPPRPEPEPGLGAPPETASDEAAAAPERGPATAAPDAVPEPFEAPAAPPEMVPVSPGPSEPDETPPPGSLPDGAPAPEPPPAPPEAFPIPTETVTPDAPLRDDPEADLTEPSRPPPPPSALPTPGTGAGNDDIPYNEAPEAPAAEPSRTRRSPLERVALAVLVIAAAALIGYVLSRPGVEPAGPDALSRTVEAAERLRIVLETDTPSEARQYVRDEFGWRVGVPVFEAVPLRGVGIAQTAPAVEVPVFLYAGDGQNVAVFAYSYALLDQVPDRLRLPAEAYEALDGGDPFTRSTGSHDVVLWRDRDDIYIAVTDVPPETLTDGLAMAR